MVKGVPKVRKQQKLFVSARLQIELQSLIGYACYNTVRQRIYDSALTAVHRLSTIQHVIVFGRLIIRKRADLQNNYS